MNKSILKIFIAVFAVVLLNNCSVGDYTDLWPTESEENTEVLIREIPSESFDPEDTEEIEGAAGTNNEVNEITIIDDMADNDSIELDANSNNVVNESASDVAPIQTYVGDRISEMRDEFSTLDEEIKQNSDLHLLKANGIASAEVYHSTVGAIAARLQIGTTPKSYSFESIRKSSYRISSSRISGPRNRIR